VLIYANTLFLSVKIYLRFSKMASYKGELIEKYVSMVFEYLSIMQSSDVVGTMNNRGYAVQLGLSSITHIFKIAFINTKNIATTETYYQKGIYCYIEYLEQFNKLSATQQIDYADAVGFVYDKTLSDLHGNGSTSIFTNILSVSQSHQAQGDVLSECLAILDQAGSIASAVLWLSNANLTLLDQIDIVEQHFVDFLCYATSPELMEPVVSFLDVLQTHIMEVDSKEYNDILSTLKRRLNVAVKKTLEIRELKQRVNDNCLLLVAHYSRKTMAQIAEQERWRKPGDDLVDAVFV